LEAYIVAGDTLKITRERHLILTEYLVPGADFELTMMSKTRGI
jgi:hypothetical protein